MERIINDYFKEIPIERRRRLTAIYDLILKKQPCVNVTFKYKMPTFELAENWVAIGNHKNYISVYTCCYDHIADFRYKHPQIKGGKGCLNFKDTDNLHEKDLVIVINKALTHKKTPKSHRP